MMRLAVAHLDLAASRCRRPGRRRSAPRPGDRGTPPSRSARSGGRAGPRAARARARWRARSAGRWSKCRTPTGSSASTRLDGCAVAAAVRAASVAASAARLSPATSRRSDSSSSVRRRMSDSAADERDGQPDDRDEERPVHAASIAYADDRGASGRKRPSGDQRRQQPDPPQQPASAIGSGRRGVEVDERPRVGRLGRPDDRADHAVGDGMRRRDRDVGAGPTASRPSRNSETDSAPAMQPGPRASLGPLGRR